MSITPPVRGRSTLRIVLCAGALLLCTACTIDSTGVSLQIPSIGSGAVGDVQRGVGDAVEWSRQRVEDAKKKAAELQRQAELTAEGVQKVKAGLELVASGAKIAP